MGAAAGFVASQLFFDDALNTAVFKTGPYAAKGPQDMLNAADSINRQTERMTVLDVQPIDSGHRATFELAVHLT